MENSHRFFANKDCKYYPCHRGLEELNCLFCYCPFYGWDPCPGNPQFKEGGGKSVKICTACTFPHRPENYDRILALLRQGPEALR